jgi:hypothetical protein
MTNDEEGLHGGVGGLVRPVQAQQADPCTGVRCQVSGVRCQVSGVSHPPLPPMARRRVPEQTMQQISFL